MHSQLLFMVGKGDFSQAFAKCTMKTTFVKGDLNLGFGVIFALISLKIIFTMEPFSKD